MPRYLNLPKDARIAVVHGLKAAVEDAARLAYAKAAIDGVEQLERSSPEEDNSTPGEAPYSSTNIGDLELKYGYPEARAEDGGIDIVAHLNLGSDGNENADWDVCYDESGSCVDNAPRGKVKIGIGINQNIDKKCFVEYKEPEDYRREPVINIETSEC